MKRPFQQQSKFALREMLKSYDCTIELPVTNLTMSQDMAFKEGIQMIEAWAHEYNNNIDSFLEYSITRKIEVFCCSGPKTIKFFGDFMTHLLYGDDTPDLRVFKRLFGNIASKRLIKYCWTTRFNLLSYLNKKDFLYKSLKKLYVTLDQATNLSPKFFPKNASKIMETFVPELNRVSLKIRNKDMISVSKWFEMLVSEYITSHKGVLMEYVQKPKDQKGKNGFIARCFKDFDATRGKADVLDQLIRTKKIEERERPKDNYKGKNHAHQESYEIRNILAQGGNKKYSISGGHTDDRDEMARKSFAVNTYAQNNLQKRILKGDGATGPSGIAAYFGKTPKPFLKSFRENESLARRALKHDMDITKKYDVTPDTSYIRGAFRNCVVQKNRGKMKAIFSDNKGKPKRKY